ncbi:MAG TPA: hypothetical protein VJ440_03910 [Candidatus Brocadiaceae bacterium]|nr:hypothetical protein [Candidatus Brocadiaceae bacterium]
MAYYRAGIRIRGTGIDGVNMEVLAWRVFMWEMDIAVKNESYTKQAISKNVF